MSSSGFEVGAGVFLIVIFIGLDLKFIGFNCSQIEEITSDAIPQDDQSPSTTINLPVFFTELRLLSNQLDLKS